MKPINIRINNIGPFVGSHTINFDSLDNIYVITGKTGSGKTTILECITYALYGRLPGSKSSHDKRHLRSDFCSSNEVSSIVFDFSLNGTTYRVERTLPYSKITKRGTKTEADETALLYTIEKESPPLHNDLFSDDTGLTLLESQKSKVDDTIEGLLLLSIDEFTRIVLLPQGEFATFLKQNSKEKKGLLLKLFPIELFTRITEKIKEEKLEKKAAFDALLFQTEQLKTSFNPETAEEEKDKLEKECKTIKINIENLHTNITHLISEQQKLHELHKKFTDFKIIENEMKELQNQKEAMEKLEFKIKNSIEAETLFPIANNYSTYSLQLENSLKEQIECKKRLELAYKEKTILDNDESLQKERIERLSELDVILHDLERCVVLQESAIALEKDFAKTSNELLNCKKELKTIHESAKDFDAIIKNEKKILAQYDKAKKEKLVHSHSILLCSDASLAFSEKNAEEALANAKLIFNDLSEQEQIQKIANTASSLADHLVSGKACPVCGSLEHPNPVNKNKDLLTISEKLKLQETVVHQAEASVQTIKNERNILRGSISESKKAFEEKDIPHHTFLSLDECLKYKEKLKQNADFTHEQVIEAEQKVQELQVAREKIATNEKLIKALEINETNFQVENAKMATKIEEQKKEIISILDNIDPTSTSCEESIKTFQFEKISLEKAHEAFATRKKNNENDMLILLEKQSHIESAIKINTEGKTEASLQLCNNIKKSKLFVNNESDSGEEHILEYIESIKNAVMSGDEKRLAQNSVDTFKNETVRIHTLHEQLKETLTDSEEDVQKKLIATQESLSAQTQKQEEVQNILSTSQQRITQLNTLLLEYLALEEKCNEVKKSYELYEKLHNVISGGNLNPKKVPLDSWILGMYLQEITIYANTRLKRMSNGRYELHLKQDAEGGNALKGLDLEIYDDYTGKSRPTASLSGGETFMTAISLALAISDIVQEQNGGIQLDSMFIDEGFGSLDAESLEKALGILDEIRETRSIGLISHVESLQSRITSQIRVNKGAGGSTVEIHNFL